ncbi:ABC-three component system protein [Dactylosporangium sucinum]|nr:ABC-three component system protein [Dactylosporangium sucinum]
MANLAGGPPPTPRQRIHFYSPDEWEEFILEWATGLEEDYFQLVRIGGSNDKGADVAGFLTRHRFEGEWDCMQCKHYEQGLQPAEAYEEMFKMIRSVVEGYYTMPRRYLFLAPQGCGKSLKRLLSAPSQLRTGFLNKFSGSKPLGEGLDPTLLAKIRAVAETLDYSMFQNVEIHEILEIHKRTPYYWHRFGGPLPERPPVIKPPVELTADEARYIEHLMSVYTERYGVGSAGIAEILTHPQAFRHLSRQREAFFSAESLRAFARDSVRPGTFERLQDEVYHAVVETHERNFSDGMERLTSVLEKAAGLTLTSSALISVSDPLDKRGICHQLANVDRLKWCDVQC